MTNIKTLSDITNNGLCIGCGLCQSILGKEKISIEMTDKGRLEPREINQLSDEDLDKVKKICPGVIVEGLPKKDVSNDSKFDTLWGYYNSLFYAWSTDEQIRFQSSTGGLLNGLSLYLLESKKVDFILHTAGDPEQPMRSIPRFSYTKQELLSCESRSRYGPASPLSKFNEALDTKKNFAFVGKPCDISAIRQLSKTDERVNKQCKFLLTLVCGGSTEFTKSQDFIKSFNVKEEELETFRYRGFGNPGRMYIKTKDGREHDREYNSFWGEESTWRVHFRCKICPDAIGESADIAALDTWRGGSPKEEDEGYNAAIVRTQKGNDLLKEAIKAGYIQKGSNLTIADINDFQPHQVSKKKAVYARHLGMKKNNLPTITTNDLRIEELYNKNSDDFNKKEELGLSTRINKI
ncbi:MAG: Coenzyme F420 hydrogenase/dehydrogenase, beta subunit C-terminal domain [Pelagibacteraceae bacterium]